MTPLQVDTDARGRQKTNVGPQQPQTETPAVARCLPVDGCVADAGDGGEDPRPVDLLLGLLAVGGTLDDELREVDLSGSDIALDGRDDCRGERSTSKRV